MRWILVFSCALTLLSTSPTSAQKKDERITARFDKFKNETHFRSEPTHTGSVTYDGGKNAYWSVRSMDVQAEIACRGQLDVGCPTSASSGFLIFTATTSGWHFSDNRELILLIDGEPLKVGTTSWDGQVLDADDLREYLEIETGPLLLIRLAKAKTVEVQLGIFEFPLTEENLAVFKELNVHLQRQEDSDSQSLGIIGIGRGERQGITITRLVPGGPAQRAGLAVGDVITAINGKQVKQVSEETELASSRPAGSSLRISYVRGTQRAEVKLVLGSDQ